MKGVHMADSFNFNPHKWLLVNFDCSTMWVRKSEEIVDAFRVDPIYTYAASTELILTPLITGALKLWFVMRMYGRDGLQRHIRKEVFGQEGTPFGIASTHQVALAAVFEALVLQDSRFETVCPAVLGLVCFRVKTVCPVFETVCPAVLGLVCFRVKVGKLALRVNVIKQTVCQTVCPVCPVFETVCPAVLGLVCFRVKAARDMNALHKRLVQRINKDGDIHPGRFRGAGRPLPQAIERATSALLADEE
ncbi:hypothetical protein HAZT_HAZT004085 [Hyalella azteca]|uniref:Aromatic-L-amino-acid decarboxylase n=1 Tax=Hyalella azteca TaxID=294128 RepID=A0A6A0H4I1_HYAAZ|nr:hypothetical protein HAZT_HAZT004085 [Hyalella azteca]